MDAPARDARVAALLMVGSVVLALLSKSICGAERILDEAGHAIDEAKWIATQECRPRWAFRVGAVILERDRPKSQPYVANAITGATVLDPADFDFPFRGGLDVAALRRGEWFDVGFRYFGIDEWIASQGPLLTGSGAVFQFTGLAPLPLPSSYLATYGTELHSVEVNLRRNVTSYLTLLAGFRYVSLQENLLVQGNFGPGFLLFDYRSRANNQLYGAQIGADAILWDNGGRLRVESAVKSGVFANGANNRVDFDVEGIGSFFSLAAVRNHTAFVGDVNFTAVFALNNQWAVRAGYQLLWLAGVAVAPEQPPLVNAFTGSSGVDTSGNVFFHGALVGLERGW